MFIKICGCRRPDDVAAAAGAGASAVGMILAPGFRRSVAGPEALRLRLAVPDGMWAVGVFLDQPLEDVLRAVADLRLEAAQLHGSEPPDYCDEVRRACRVIKSWPGGGAPPTCADLVLAEPAAGRSGGQGRTWDWGLVRGSASGVPLVLSGGLDSGNVARACAAARPWGVDASSGVESDGVKDPARIAAFCDAVRRWEADGGGA